MGLHGFFLSRVGTYARIRARPVLMMWGYRGLRRVYIHNAVDHVSLSSIN